jgi:hypothetical protein
MTAWDVTVIGSAWKKLTAIVAGIAALVAGISAFVTNIDKILPQKSSIKTANWKVDSVSRVPRSRGDYAVSFLEVESLKEGFLPIKDCFIEISYPNGFAIERTYIDESRHKFSYGFFREYHKIETFVHWAGDGLLVRQFIDARNERKSGSMRARIRCTSIETEWQDIDVPGHDGWKREASE